MRKLLGALSVVIMSVLAVGQSYAAPITLQTSFSLHGNQVYSGVGVRFTANSSVLVTDLGIYDSGLDGIIGDNTILTAVLFRQSNGSVLASQSFTSASQGVIDGHYLFKDIIDVLLQGGEDYVLAGFGWNRSNPEHNSNINGSPDFFNNGGGLLTYLGSPFGGSTTVMPTTECCGNANFFSSANMKYTEVSEPATIVLLTLGLAGIVLLRRRDKAKHLTAS